MSRQPLAPTRLFRLPALLLLLLPAVRLLGPLPTPAAFAEDDRGSLAERLEFFEQKIRPVLVERCYECHAGQSKVLQGGLRLDSRSAVVSGGDSGAAMVPGQPDESLLIEAIRYGEDSYQMPPDGKLPDAVVADFERWIGAGGAMPDDARQPIRQGSIDFEAAARHWAFQPPVKSAPPAVKQAAWPRDDIDRYVLARLEAAGLSPSPAADRPTLIRRLYFDLAGLPPAYDEVEAFVDDTRADAVERLVDRLLASPHFGERWARHWLDVARYADTKGYVFREDRNYPEAYKYRDWVIRAFHRDLPYDRFLVEQIAADRLVAQGADADLAAMGFLTLGRRFLNRQPDIIDDRIDLVCRGTMGLTVGCARCHDHKYDPVPTADYYSLYGVFASSTEPKNAPCPLRMEDAAQPVTPRIFIRGDARNPGDPVPRQFLRIVAGEDRQPYEQGSGRLEMARSIASPDNPLTARVMANRVWGHLCGRGLVDTPSDFGIRSDPPTHPRLLDDLAVTFVDQGWSVKRLIRRIVLSSTYRQASHDRGDCRAVDPENRLLWRHDRRRLDFETLRDSLLAAAGRLDPAVGGPPVQLDKPPLPTRRTLYGFIDRQNLPGSMRVFDFASPDQHAPKRYETTVPQQALYLMNSPFAMEQAAHLAERAVAADAAQRAGGLFRFVYGRDPDPAEVVLAVKFIESELAEQGGLRPHENVWQYGYGEYDADTQCVPGFRPLPHFTGTAWQGGPKLPDPKIGWVLLNAAGGHPGNDPQHAAIRRWVAPFSGAIALDGDLRHPSDQGDGVRARIVSSRTGLVGEWTAQKGTASPQVAQLMVEAGDTIDCLVDCRAHPNFDGFSWTVEIRREPSVPGAVNRWRSADEFRGQMPAQLNPWTRLAHVLLMSNEFMFVD